MVFNAIYSQSPASFVLYNRMDVGVKFFAMKHRDGRFPVFCVDDNMIDGVDFAHDLLVFVVSCSFSEADF